MSFASISFDMVLPMNTGAEAVETALKLARKWAYRTKGVKPNKAIILSATDNFHGRTLAVVSMSTDESATAEFGPFLDSIGPMCPVKGKERQIRYNNVEDLEMALEAHGKDVAAFLIEPIQGEAGIIIPDDDYLERCQFLCRKHNVLLICDEIQTGLGRTGKLYVQKQLSLHWLQKSRNVLKPETLLQALLPTQSAREARHRNAGKSSFWGSVSGLCGFGTEGGDADNKVWRTWFDVRR